MAIVARRSKRVLAGFIGTLVVNAAFDAVALYPIAESSGKGQRIKQWTKEDLDRLRFPPNLRFVFPIVKGGAAAGFLVGLKSQRLGSLTSILVIAYFVLAVLFHARVRDPFVLYVPAIGMLAFAIEAHRSLVALHDEGHLRGARRGPIEPARSARAGSNQ